MTPIIWVMRCKKWVTIHTLFKLSDTMGKLLTIDEITAEAAIVSERWVTICPCQDGNIVQEYFSLELKSAGKYSKNRTLNNVAWVAAAPLAFISSMAYFPRLKNNHTLWREDFAPEPICCMFQYWWRSDPAPPPPGCGGGQHPGWIKTLTSVAIALQ